MSDVDGRELASTVTTLLTLDKSSVVYVLASVQAVVVTFASSGSLQQAPSRKPSMQADSMVPSWRMHSQLNMQSPVSPCTPSHGLLPIVHCFQGVTEVKYLAEAAETKAPLIHRQALVMTSAVHRISITSL